jgi:hypothetical protein
MTYDNDEKTMGRPRPRHDKDHDDGVTEGPERGQREG